MYVYLATTPEKDIITRVSGNLSESHCDFIRDFAALDRVFYLLFPASLIPTRSLLVTSKTLSRKFRNFRGRRVTSKIQIELNARAKIDVSGRVVSHPVTGEETFLSHLPWPSTTIDFVLRTLRLSPLSHENYLCSRVARSSSSWRQRNPAGRAEKFASLSAIRPPRVIMTSM